jgi:hypothetical protein
MRTFSRPGERVKVLRTEDDVKVDRYGAVTRICSDGRAWIKLDKAHLAANADGKVRAYPGDCEIAEEDARGRRRATREAARPQIVTPEMFGRDHETTLLYIETRCVDYGGIVMREHMRCDVERHPLLAHSTTRHVHPPEACPSTRLADGSLLSQHDDWDCVDDMIACGWIVEAGGVTEPRFMLTDAGFDEAHRLRRERARRAQPTAIAETS